MEISREEIEEIAKAVAETVLDRAKACRCGVEMWALRTNINSLGAVIEQEREEWLGPIPKLIDSRLKEIEGTCGVDLPKSKEILKEVESAITKGDWREARLRMAFLEGSVLGPVVGCAMREESEHAVKPTRNEARDGQLPSLR
ncbi:hypothetical protein ES703_06349 [subsurface metagenome]